MFINEAYAAAEPVMETTPALSGTLIQLALILLIFYFLLIRPQQKRVKEHVSLVDQLKVGDAVVTNSGIHGVIARVDETTLSLEIAPNVVIELEKMAVSGLVEKTPQKVTKKAAGKGKKK